MTHCVPPPLPRVEPPPLPVRRRGVSVVVLLCVLVVPGALLVFLSGVRDERGAVIASAESRSKPSRATASTPRPPTPSVSAKIDQFVAGVQKAARTTTRNKVKELCDLDAEKLGAPPDFELYRDQVKVLAQAPTFSQGHAQKLARLGRPTFLAGIALLQCLDYEDADECRCAANLHKFLAHVTAIEGLSVEAPACDPSGPETCRFMVVADGWRRLAEQFAKDDVDFRKMLVGKGKLAPGADR